MISIILPTYNESESIIQTIEKIRATMKNTSYSYEIIVADDDSPDKTWELVQQKYAKEKNISVLRRTKTKKGLGPSVIDGFKKAKGDLLFVMDADGQHDEKKIPKMIKAAKNSDSDIVIGTRFRDGGSVKGWSKKRIFMSRVAALMARPMLDQNVSDPMSGFFAIKKEKFLEVQNKVNPMGYKILLEFLFALPKAKIAEVGFRFGLREEGESKLGSDVIIQYIQMLIKQGIKKYGRFLKFCIVGLSGLIVNEGLLYYMTEYQGLFYLYSAAIAIEVSIITNFLLNNFWTWNRGKKNFFNRLWKFNTVSVLALIINLSVLYIFTSLLGLHYLISNIIGIVAATFINFIANDRWTFKKIKGK